METSGFYGARLRLARSIHRWTQAELAGRVGVTTPFICQLETSRKRPAPGILEALSEALNFPTGFFARPLEDEFRDEDCNFRRRKTTPLKLRSQILAYGTLFCALVEYLEEHLALPVPNVPHFPASSREGVERAAEKSRRHWQLGLDAPISNMVRVLERLAGVVVARFVGAEDLSAKIDAFSRAGARDIVVLNPTTGSTSRARYDLAHELGHLVMHKGVETGSQEREEEANQFAGAFLLPRVGFVRDYGTRPRIHWTHLFALKRQWGVSVAAMVKRAHDLGLIGAIEYRRAYKYIHAKGWNKGEPDEPAEERPEIIPLAFAELQRVSRKTPWDVAEELRVPHLVLQQLTGDAVRDSGHR